jgi:glycosyltransferase involved in cell wall biosynthesis
VLGPRSGHFARSWFFFRSLRPEVIVFVDNDFQAFHWRMYLAARLSGARRVVTIEHLIAATADVGASVHARGGKARWFLDRLSGLARRRMTTRLPGLVCHLTICVSEAVGYRLVHEYGYPTAKTLTRRNGVDLRHFSKDAREWATPEILVGEETAPIVVCVAQLVQQKRIDLLIQAMKRVAVSFPESRCVIVGRGDCEDRLRVTVKELGLERQVLFAGQTDDVRPYLAASDIFVLPSDREGLPLALLEAMAFGLPCVAAEAGGTGEAIEDGISGLMVTPRSPEALAEAISRLLGDPEERVRMGRSARRLAERQFDIEQSMAGLKSAILGEA